MCSMPTVFYRMFLSVETAGLDLIYVFQRDMSTRHVKGVMDIANTDISNTNTQKKCDKNRGFNRNTNATTHTHIYIYNIYIYMRVNT